VPLEPKGRLFTVPVSVNGRMTSMVLDTGAKVNLLTDAAAERLGVVRDGRTATIVTGMAGGSLRADGRLDSMSLGGVPLSVDRISVNSYPGFDGVLGLASLKDFDLDIDAPNRALTLYRVRTCERADRRGVSRLSRSRVHPSEWAGWRYRSKSTPVQVPLWLTPAHPSQ
jgi:Aspartyl protease